MAFSKFTGNFAPSANALKSFESITAVDLALSVPFVRMTAVNDQGIEIAPGKPTVSFLFVSPPSFGSTSDIRFRERPPASLESLRVKTSLSVGTIFFREYDLTFIVHQPDIISSTDPVYKNFSLLFSPQQYFLIEYGWSSTSQNDMINGTGVDNIEGLHRAIIAVITYDFSIKTNGEISVVLHLKEQAESLITRITPGSTLTTAVPSVDPVSALDFDVLAKLQDGFNKVMQNAKKDTNKKTKYVLLSDLLDGMIGDFITGACRISGYTKVDLYLGNFNARCPGARAEYGGSMAGKSIGDFWIPVPVATAIMNNMKQNEEQMTVTNILEKFLSVLRDQSVWTGESPTDDVPLNPDIGTRMISIGDSSGGEHRARAEFYIVDQQNFYAASAKTDELAQDFKTMPKPDRIKKLSANNVPYIQLGTALSYVKDSTFEVVQNELQKTIMIQNTLSPTRQQIVASSNKQVKEQGPDPRQLIYSSAIQGTLTMIGNFVFDTFALLWIDLNVPIWSGFFNIVGKEDFLDSSGFTSTITVRSSGGDPLGTRNQT